MEVGPPPPSQEFCSLQEHSREHPLLSSSSKAQTTLGSFRRTLIQRTQRKSTSPTFVFGVAKPEHRDGSDGDAVARPGTGRWCLNAPAPLLLELKPFCKAEKPKFLKTFGEQMHRCCQQHHSLVLDSGGDSSFHTEDVVFHLTTSRHEIV